MKKQILVIASALLAIATIAQAQLSMEKADWVRGPVQFLMTPQEKQQWDAVKSDADADKFIALFWAKRDPSPNTPRNEFKEEFDRRVAFADKNFAGPSQRGALTDRGRILILFGVPTKVLRKAPTAQNPIANPTQQNENETSTTEQVAGEQQTWVYDGPNAEKLFGSPHVELEFIDRLNNHDMRLQPARIDLRAAQQHIVEGEIVQPNLTEVPTYRQAEPAQQATPAAPAAPMTTLKTAALETAVADAKAGKADSKGAVFSYAQFLSPFGEFYVPAGLYIPASSGIAPDAADTFFGVVDDATGKRVTAFEEPAALMQTKGNLFVDKTLELPSGKYTAVFGLAKAGAPVVMVSAPLEINALPKDATGTSQLILSNDVQMQKVQSPVKTPYAFGQLKIIPKADLTFSNKDDLNYFVEIHNPGIAAAAAPAETSTAAPAAQAADAGHPKLQMKLEIDNSKGQPVAGSPLTEIDAAPLAGKYGPGEYAIINGIPLSQLSKPLAPGEYTLKMKIVDTVNKQSYNLEQKFRIAA